MIVLILLPLLARKETFFRPGLHSIKKKRSLRKINLCMGGIPVS